MPEDSPKIPIHKHSATARFLSDHLELSEHVQTILVTDDVDVAREAAEAIAATLSGHLLVEEGPSGIFELMRQANPDLGPSLDRLADDHKRLRAILAALPERRGSAGELEAIKELGRLLEVHEIREQAALTNAQKTANG